MFNLRANQLKRSVSNYLLQIDDENVKQFANKIMKKIFDEQKTNLQDSTPLILFVYENLNQINLLGQIFSRSLSLLATDEPNLALFYKLNGLVLIGELIITELSHEKVKIPLDIGMKLTLDQQKFKTLQEEIRTFKKNENKGITNLEGVINFLLDVAMEKFETITKINSWEELLGFVFGVSVDNNPNEVKEIEHINIKELLLSYQLEGSLIDSIYEKYDGLLAYSMSLLTMISGTSYAEEFTEKLNSVLESLGGSTTITLLTSRLFKNLQLRDTDFTIINEIQQNILKRAQSETINIDSSEIELFFKQLNLAFTIGENIPLSKDVRKLQNYQSVFSIAQFFKYRVQLQEVWEHFTDIYHELKDSLLKLDNFFLSIIKKANTVSADLFSKGFQAAIPLCDVITCEDAGIHLKNLTATSSTIKTKISDEKFHTKLELVRQYERNWKTLKKILEQKSQEELSIESISPELKLFNELFLSLQKMFQEWNAWAVINGYNEEVVMVSRILYSVDFILKQMLEILIPYGNVPFSGENLSEFIPVLAGLSKRFVQMKKFGKIVLVINQITKKLWLLNREYVITIAEESQYIENPDLITTLIDEIPKILVREYRQRLIPLELKKGKTKVYNELLLLINEIKAISSEDRMILFPYSDISLD